MELELRAESRFDALPPIRCVCVQMSAEKMFKAVEDHYRNSNDIKIGGYSTVTYYFVPFPTIYEKYDTEAPTEWFGSMNLAREGPGYHHKDGLIWRWQIPTDNNELGVLRFMKEKESNSKGPFERLKYQTENRLWIADSNLWMRYQGKERFRSDSQELQVSNNDR